MKISHLQEGSVSGDPGITQNNQQAPKFGRDPTTLEQVANVPNIGFKSPRDPKVLEKKVEETTTAGAVASVAQPMGKMQKRSNSIFSGIKTSSKYANSRKAGIYEDEISEEQLKAKHQKEELFKKALARDLGKKSMIRDIIAKEAKPGSPLPGSDDAVAASDREQQIDRLKKLAGDELSSPRTTDDLTTSDPTLPKNPYASAGAASPAQPIVEPTTTEPTTTEPVSSAPTPYKGSTAAQAIQKLNPSIQNVNDIKVGQELTLPSGQKYTVQRGDTLDKLGRVAPAQQPPAQQPPAQQPPAVTQKQPPAQQPPAQQPPAKSSSWLSDVGQTADDAMRKTANTLTLGLADKLAAGMSTDRTTPYSTALANQERQSAEAEKRSPIASGAGTVAGYAIPAAGALKGVVGGVKAGTAAADTAVTAARPYMGRVAGAIKGGIDKVKNWRSPRTKPPSAPRTEPTMGAEIPPKMPSTSMEPKMGAEIPPKMPRTSMEPKMGELPTIPPAVKPPPIKVKPGETTADAIKRTKAELDPMNKPLRDLGVEPPIKPPSTQWKPSSKLKTNVAGAAGATGIVGGGIYGLNKGSQARQSNSTTQPATVAKESSLSEAIDQWYIVMRGNLDFRGNYNGKGDDLSGPFPKVKANAELHKTHPYDRNWTMVPATALQRQSMNESASPQEVAAKKALRSGLKKMSNTFPNMLQQLVHEIKSDGTVVVVNSSDTSAMNNVKRILELGGGKNFDVVMAPPGPGWKSAKTVAIEGETWSKHNNPRAGGMSKKSVSSYRRSHPGSKIQTAVTTKPSKLKKGSKSAKRRASFCARMRGMKKHRTGAKTARDPNSNINKSLRRWHCESVAELNQLVMIAEQKINEAKNWKQQAAIAISKKEQHVGEARGDYKPPKEADYGYEYQQMVKRVGQKAKEQEKRKQQKPTDKNVDYVPVKESAILKGLKR